MHLSALTTQSSKSTATAVAMAGAITVVEATTMDGVEAIIMVITIGETSLPLMLIILGEAAFGRLFLLVAPAFPRFALFGHDAISDLSPQCTYHSKCGHLIGLAHQLGMIIFEA